MNNTNNTASIIAAAVEPARAASIEAAKVFAKELADKTLALLIEDPTLGHYPSSSKYPSKTEYMMRKRMYERIISLTSAVPGTRDRQANQTKITAFVEEAGKDADLQFTAFVQKLEVKVGACTAASLDGDHVWGYSFLTVTKEDGSQETWKTQQIINVSALGKLFNQWPTRKQKPAKAPKARKTT